MARKKNNKLSTSKSYKANIKPNKSNKKATHNPDDINEDDSDFQDEYGNISLNKSKSTFEEEDDDEEEVFNLNNEDDEDYVNDDDDSDYGNDLKDLVNNLSPELRSKILLNKKVEYDSDDDNNDSKKELNSRDWGKKKSYYSGDVNDLEIDQDFEDAEEEEETAKELIQEKYSKMKESDFFEDDDNELDNLNVDDYIKKNSSNIKRKDKILGNLEAIALGKSDGIMEEIERDDSNLTDDQRIALVQKESPELPALLEDLQDKLEDLKSKIEPIKAMFDKLQEYKDSQDDIVQYLEMKQQLMLSYCVNIMFYLYMKSTGQSVKNHPVMMQLLEHRYTMEKLRPLDGKLKYQIDRLLKLSLQTENPVTSDDIKTALLRPNPDDFFDDDDEDDNEGEDEYENNDNDEINNEDEDQDDDEDEKIADDNSDIEDDMVENTKSKKSVHFESKESTGIYKPPRFQPMAYHDKASKDEEKLQQQILRKKKKLRNNAIIESLEEEYGDKPEGVSSSGLTVINSSDKELLEDENERRDFEEDRFIRLTMTRKEKNERKKKELSANRLDDLANIDNIDDLDELSELLNKTNKNEDNENTKDNRKKTLSNNENDNTSNDLTNKLLEKFMSNYSKSDVNNMSGGRRKAPDTNFNDIIDDDKVDLLEQFTLKKKELLLKKKEHYEPEPLYGSTVDAVYDDATIGKKRAATYEMITNRGLTPHRNKLNRNARVKKRVKYDNAKVRLKGAHRTLRVGETDRYVGETSGIKSTVSRSRKF